MKIAFLNIATLLLATASYAQGDFAIVPQNLNDTIRIGDTAIVKITIYNMGGNSYRVNSLRATNTAPGNGKYVGLVNDGTYESSDIWTISSISDEETGNSVHLVNTGGAMGGAPFDPDASTDVYLYLVGVEESDPKIFGSNIGFNALPVDSFSSRSAQGNLNTSNDNNSTSLAVIDSPLPVTFLSVNAQWKSNDALVSWNVALEQNNDYFAVERSFNGKNFQEAGRVKSLGDFTGQRNYTFTDLAIKARTADKVYYRVRQYDIDGKNTLTKIVSLQADNAGSINALLFPNPTTGAVKFVYENSSLKGSNNLEVQVLDVQGRLLLEKQLTTEQGKGELMLDLSAYAAGSYLLNYRNEEHGIKGSLRLAKD